MTIDLHWLNHSTNISTSHTMISRSSPKLFRKSMASMKRPTRNTWLARIKRLVIWPKIATLKINHVRMLKNNSVIYQRHGSGCSSPIHTVRKSPGSSLSSFPWMMICMSHLTNGVPKSLAATFQFMAWLISVRWSSSNLMSLTTIFGT